MAVDPLAVHITESNQVFVKKVRVLWKLLRSYNFLNSDLCNPVFGEKATSANATFYIHGVKVTILDLCS